MGQINLNQHLNQKKLLECLLEELEEGRKPLDMHGMDQEGLKKFVRDALEKFEKEIKEGNIQ